MTNASQIAQDVATGGTPLFAYVALLVGLAVGIGVLIALALKGVALATDEERTATALPGVEHLEPELAA